MGFIQYIGIGETLGIVSSRYPCFPPKIGDIPYCGTFPSADYIEDDVGYCVKQVFHGETLKPLDVDVLLLPHPPIGS